MKEYYTVCKKKYYLVELPLLPGATYDGIIQLSDEEYERLKNDNHMLLYQEELLLRAIERLTKGSA